jgi:hypothetical protein
MGRTFPKGTVFINISLTLIIADLLRTSIEGAGFYDSSGSAIIQAISEGLEEGPYSSKKA